MLYSSSRSISQSNSGILPEHWGRGGALKGRKECVGWSLLSLQRPALLPSQLQRIHQASWVQFSEIRGNIGDVPEKRELPKISSSSIQPVEKFGWIKSLPFVGWELFHWWRAYARSNLLYLNGTPLRYLVCKENYCKYAKIDFVFLIYCIGFYCGNGLSIVLWRYRWKHYKRKYLGFSYFRMLTASTVGC